MSANNQTLLVKHKDKWLVYQNVQAEDWCEIDDNGTIVSEDSILKETEANGVYDKFENAFEYADKLEEEDPTEYGIRQTLAKTGTKVIIK